MSLFRIFLFIILVFASSDFAFAEDNAKPVKTGLSLATIRAALENDFFTEADSQPVKLLNVSYDPTREFYNEYNKLFSKYWRNVTDGGSVEIKQSHGGSGKQARAVIDGLKADVVTLALAYDIDEIAERTGKIDADWQKQMPYNSSPYYSTIVFLVRKGNPKGIKDWGDLIKDGVSVITPNPKTSGGARWNYLAAWAYADKLYNHDETKIKEFVTKLYKNVPVLDTGARGSTTTFVQRNLGDVLLAWENEAFLAVQELGADKFEIVVPSISMRTEPPVAVVAGNTDGRGTSTAARAYLYYLYSSEAQELAAKFHYRPADPDIAKKFANKFPVVNMTDINNPLFGGWRKTQTTHFSDGGIFDTIYTPKSE